MKQQYNNTPSRGGFNILSALGFAFAILLTAGYLKRNGGMVSSEMSIYDTDREMEDLQMSMANLNPAERATAPVNRTRSSKPKPYNSYKREEVRQPKMISVENWINRFDEFAKEQALVNGIPAGVSLAMGITKLDAGIPIRSAEDFMRAVVEPLTHLKKNAPFEHRSAYFKYAANSDRWADGLGATGRYSSSSLKDLIARYQLDALDRQVRNEIVHAPSDSKIVERKVEYIANEVSEINNERYMEVERPRHAVSRAERARVWEQEYEASVGNEVAKEVARKKLKSGNYLTDEDMQRLIEETDAETGKALENKVMFMGRKINKKHSKAGEKTDITNPKNAHARGERYQNHVKKGRN
ncbi:MAG: hypothetical protein AAGG68_04525 [Bacteroidota bacterium]